MSSRSSALLQAVTSGDERALNQILLEGANVNETNDGGQTPLILAIVSGKHHFLRRLLDAGADPFLRDNTGLNAIDWAERKGRNDLAQLLATNIRPGDSLTSKSEPKPSIATKEVVPREKPWSDDEKSRRFLAGLKQRFDEQAARQEKEPHHVPARAEESISEKSGADVRGVPQDVAPLVAPKEVAQRVVTKNIAPRVAQEDIAQPVVPENIAQRVVPEDVAARDNPKPNVQTSEAHTDEAQVGLTLSNETRSLPPNPKRCPQCNRIYNGDLVAYCSYHAVPLVDANEPTVTPRANSSAVLLWTLVLITVSVAAFSAFFLTSRLFKSKSVTPPTASAPPVTTSRKGLPVVGSDLAGKAVSLPEAEVPLNSGGKATAVTVRVRVDRQGRVYSARSSSDDPVLRHAAIEAAKRATFSVEKLGGRGATGKITYTFNP